MRIDAGGAHAGEILGAGERAVAVDGTGAPPVDVELQLPVAVDDPAIAVGGQRRRGRGDRRVQRGVHAQRRCVGPDRLQRHGGMRALRADAIGDQQVAVTLGRQLQRDPATGQVQADGVARAEQHRHQRDRQLRLHAAVFLHAENALGHHVQVRRHRPQLARRIDHRAAELALVHVLALGQQLVVFHVGADQRRAAHHRGDLVGDARRVVDRACGAQRVGADERPDRAVVIDRLVAALGPDHRTAGRPGGVVFQRLPRAFAVGHAADDRQRDAEQVVAVHRRAVAADVAHVHAAIGAPEVQVDRLLQRRGLGAVGVPGGSLVIGAGLRGGQLQRLVVQHVGRQRERLPDEGHLVGGPRRVGLFAPVQERGLAAVQAEIGVERVLPVLRQGVAQGRAHLVGERGIVLQVPRGEEPHHAIRADRPAAARAGVLHHVQALRRGWFAHAGQLELQPVARAGAVEPPQAEVDRVRQVARPHVWPLQPGLETVAGNRRAVVERAVADRAHRVLAQIVLRHRVQAVEQRTGGIGLERLRRNHPLPERPVQGVGVLRVTPDAHVHAVPVQPVMPCGRFQRRAGHGGSQHQAQHGESLEVWRGVMRLMCWILRQLLCHGRARPARCECSIHGTQPARPSGMVGSRARRRLPDAYVFMPRRRGSGRLPTAGRGGSCKRAGADRIVERRRGNTWIKACG